MSFSEIVIEDPPGTVVVSIAPRVGPLEGELDVNLGADELGAIGFAATDDGRAFWDPQGQSGGVPARVALSEAGIVTLSFHAGGGEDELVPGTAAAIAQPHAEVAEHAAGRAPAIAQPHAEVAEHAPGSAPGIPRSVPAPRPRPALPPAPRAAGTRPAATPRHEPPAQPEPGSAAAIEQPHPEVGEREPGTRRAIGAPREPEATVRRVGTAKTPVAQPQGRDPSAELPAPGSASPVPKPTHSLTEWTLDPAGRLVRKQAP